jgi:hypothetical protein
MLLKQQKKWYNKLMYDLEKRDEIPSTSLLSKQGFNAIICGAGGVLLIVLQIVSRFRVMGLVISAIVCVIGLVTYFSKDSTDRKPGIVITAAGTLALLSKIPAIAPLTSTILTIGAFGLIALGVINGLKFFSGLRKRS